ncbi:succinate dehydrogenase flavoprotein [Histoplasma capsulatum var. duboisii H88]|uniref:Succinate dehydrogenase flavoprotein n=1 Tax=Ajellomyces capsulatus (strain H88) TaxID=544711 RepID=A0A8A1LFV8_AJEC8|nr:succinate dehydrogenase flavoprotein [Histoplasma capsulatum var. duboisii H88]
MKLNDYRYDALVGAGGAGLIAAVGLAQSGLETPCISKLFPTRSHSSCSRGHQCCSREYDSGRPEMAYV